MLLGLITLAIVVSLQAIGNILVLAMLVTPAATARLLTQRLATMQVLSAALGVAAGVVGLYISFWWNVASGGAVVLTATAIFFAVFAAVELGPRLRPRAVRRAGNQRPPAPDGVSNRRVAAVQHDRVAVGVMQEGHMADAGIDRLAAELDAVPLEGRPRLGHIRNPQRDAVVVRLERTAPSAQAPTRPA